MMDYLATKTLPILWSLIDPATLCKIFFTLGIAIGVGGTLIPSFRHHIMNYGSRGSVTTIPKNIPTYEMEHLVQYVASFQVPHSWFTHYYVISVASSVFWAFQIYHRGWAFKLLVSFSEQTSTPMTINQVLLAWVLMATQGIRRLYESFTLTKASQSTMWIGLWILGSAYYVFIGISVWIEGIPALDQTGTLDTVLDVSWPSLKTWIAVPLFLIASGIQHDCHKYLATLKKYTLPQHPLFKWVVCPHYTSECLIYTAIAIVAAPEGYLLNKTVLAGLGFVASNLAVTADSTRKWYAEKFGIKNLGGRSRMVPYLY